MAIIDSSTLVSFAKINRLEIIKQFKTKIRTIPEVYKECVKDGIALGYPDALKIKQLFDEKIIQIKDVKNFKKYSGVSMVDSMLISNAKDNEDYLFADDVKLGRRAKAENIEVRNTADILLHLMKTRRLNKNEFKELLQKLVDKGRLSEESKKYYEKMGD